MFTRSSRWTTYHQAQMLLWSKELRVSLIVCPRSRASWNLEKVPATFRMLSRTSTIGLSNKSSQVPLSIRSQRERNRKERKISRSWESNRRTKRNRRQLRQTFWMSSLGTLSLRKWMPRTPPRPLRITSSKISALIRLSQKDSSVIRACLWCSQRVSCKANMKT